MDELETLRSVREDLGRLDAGDAARLRERTFSMIGLDDAHVSRPGAALGGGIDVDGAFRPAAVARCAGSGRAKRGFVVVGAAALVVLVLVGVLVARHRGSGSAEVVDAPLPTLTLDDLVTRAAQTPDEPLPARRFRYRATDETAPWIAPNGEPVTAHFTRQEWIDTEGNGRDVLSDRSFRSPGSTSWVPQPGTGSDGMYVSTTPGIGFGSLTYAQVRSLPSAPVELEPRIFRDASGTPNDAQLPGMLADLLSWPETPPAVRAGALRLLGEHGAVVIASAVDHDGRHGVGVAVAQGDDQTLVLVLDPDSLRLMGDYTVMAGAALDPATALAWHTVTETSVRDTRN